MLRLFLPLLLLFAGVNIVSAQNATQTYTAVVDAGSSGTRLYFFKVTAGAYPNYEFIVKYENKVSPSPGNLDPDDGIDNYVCNTNPFYDKSKINIQVMNSLWQSLKGKATELNVAPQDIVVKVFATAGMRTAAEQCGQPAVDNLYKSILNGMKATEFGFTNVQNEARTIEGGEEAIWSWVNVNDVYQNSFNNPTKAAGTAVGAPVGILEVGGSSIQIAYPVSTVTRPNTYNVKINNKSFNVFGISYLHLGQDDVRKNLRLSQSNSHRSSQNSPTYGHPEYCWAKGFGHVNDLGENGDTRYPLINADGSYTSPNNPICYNFMTSEISRIMTIDPQVQNTSVNFVGVSGITYTLRDFGQTSTPSQLPTAVIQKCSSGIASWTGIDTNASLQRACPNGTYISALLQDPSVGIFKSKPNQFTKALVEQSSSGGAGDVPNGSLSWIYGYLLVNYTQ